MMSVRLSQNPVRVVSYSLVLLLLAVSLTGCSGCGSSDKRSTDTLPPAAIDNGGSTDGSDNSNMDDPGKEPIRTPTVDIPELKTIYFDYDKSDLRPDATSALNANAEWLTGHGDVVIQVEGHCDERGSREYNISLGERRAKSVIKYLVGKGVDAERMYFISYGEDRPIALGHDDAAWSQNRRAEFKRYVEQ